jgi:hypothetical protein
MDSVYRVVQNKSGQEMNRFVDLDQACVLWVKYPGERQVEEVTSGTNDVVKRISADECCRVLLKWLAANKQLREVERSDMTQLINEACSYRS